VKAVYRWWSVLLFAAVIVQIGFAGYGAFYVAGKSENDGDIVTHKQFENGWDYHAGFGYIVVLGGLVAFVLALLARLGRPRVLLALGVALLFVLQVILAWTGFGVAAIGALHPINAVVLAGLTGMIASRGWREKT
jgi:hypothetical protein